MWSFDHIIPNISAGNNSELRNLDYSKFDYGNFDHKNFDYKIFDQRNFDSPRFTKRKQVTVLYRWKAKGPALSSYSLLKIISNTKLNAQ